MKIQLYLLSFALFCAFLNVVHYLVSCNHAKKLLYVLINGKIRKLHRVCIFSIVFIYAFDYVVSGMNTIIDVILFLYMIVISIDGIIQRKKGLQGSTRQNDRVGLSEP